LAAICVGSASAVAAFVVACIPDLPFTANASSKDGSVEGSDGDASAIHGDSSASPEGGRCGDGVIQLARGEQCDPGTAAAPDATPNGCTADCQMACGAGVVWSRNNHCYTLSNPSDSLDVTAVQECSDVGGHLVTLASQEELNEVVQFVVAADKTNGPLWVGFEPVPGSGAGGEYNYYSLASFEPGWTSTCPGCYVHDLDAGSLPGAGACVIAPLDQAIPWKQRQCEDGGTKFRVVCEREPAGLHSEACDGGVCIDLVWTFGQKRYLFVGAAGAAAAADAETRCEAAGGTLVVLQSRDEREQLWRELSALGAPDAVWVGLSMQDGGDWIWADDAGAGAYPSPFASTSLGTGTQAYLAHAKGDVPPPPNDTLADNAQPATNALAFVCQLPVTGGGP
jgi:hypothetical protein